MIPSRFLITAVVSVVMITLPGWSEAECSRSDNDAQDPIVYLRGQLQLPEQSRDAACITAAIKHLRSQPSAEATRLLIQYLDFSRPLTAAEQHGFWSQNPDSGIRYPAIATLVSFRKVPVEALLLVVKSSPSELVRRNATTAIMGIFGGEEEQAITLLAHARQTGAPAEAARLSESLQWALRWCSLRRTQCEDALRNANGNNTQD